MLINGVIQSVELILILLFYTSMKMYIILASEGYYYWLNIFCENLTALLWNILFVYSLFGTNYIFEFYFWQEF